MSCVLVVAETAAHGTALAGAVASLGLKVEAVTASAKAAEALAGAGITVVHLLERPPTDGPPAPVRLAGCAAPIAQIAREIGAGLVVTPDSYVGRDLGAAVATLLDVGLVSGASSVKQTGNGLETVRITYAGAALQHELLDGTTVVVLQAAPVRTVAAGSPPGNVLPHHVTPDDRVSVTVAAQEDDGVAMSNLRVASKVVGVGLGFRARDDLSLADDLAQALGGAAVGCTRPIADDRRWRPSDTYIGISGARLAADLFIALGISGQVQHTVGLRDVRVVVAVNKDPAAPIFAAADYGIVGDLYQVVPALTRQLRDRQAAMTTN